MEKDYKSIVHHWQPLKPAALSPCVSQDSSTKLVHHVRKDRKSREEILASIRVYWTRDNKQCISDGSQHVYLPASMSEWEEQVRWCFRKGIEQSFGMGQL